MMILALIMMMAVKPSMPEMESADVMGMALGIAALAGMTMDATIAPAKACRIRIVARTFRLRDARALLARSTPASMK
ncbi:hypothetical protein D3C72_2177200 [compost metagenome]